MVLLPLVLLAMLLLLPLVMLLFFSLLFLSLSVAETTAQRASTVQTIARQRGTSTKVNEEEDELEVDSGQHSDNGHSSCRLMLLLLPLRLLPLLKFVYFRNH